MALVAALLAALCVLAVLGGASAAAQDQPAADEAGPPAPPDAAALRAFLDGFFTNAVVEEPVPGAAVSAVVAGEPFARAYGIREVGTTQDVSIYGTMFPARDVSQVVTAVAALRLVDAGVLTLDAGIDRWLDEAMLPAAPPGAPPLTLADLLSHTAGLDGTAAATLEASQEDVLPLEAHLSATPLRRTLPPGQVVRPTDEAATLVGRLVEAVSGEPFTEHVAANVLGPLRMRGTGFTEPDRGELAVGYLVTEEGLQASPYGYYQTAPAQSLVSNSTDMTALLQMLLSDGVAPDGTVVLSPEANDLLLSRQRANHSALPGVSLGLFEHVENGERAWVRVGTGLGISSLLLVMPEHDLAFYAVYNSDHQPVREDLVDAFFDAFFPVEPEPAEPTSLGAEDLARLAGGYAPERDRRTFLGLRSRLFEQVTVTVAEGGTLAVDDERWQPVRAPAQDPVAGGGGVREGPLFAAVDDPDRHLAFGLTDEGEVAYLFPEHDVGSERDETLFRQPWTSTAQGFRAVGGGFAVAFLAVVLGGLLQRRRSGGAHPGLRGLALVIAVANLGFLVLLPLGLALVGADVRIDYGIPIGFVVLLAVPVLTLALSIVLVVSALVALGRRRLSPGGLVAPLLVAALGLLFALVAAGWNVLGPIGLRPYV